MATLVTKVAAIDAEKAERSVFAYRVMLAFSFLYYFRPGDVIPGLSAIPLAKITGAIAVLALLFGTRKRRAKVPAEIKLIMVMLCWMAITLPFAYWRMGSLTVVAFEFSKALIVGLALTLAVSRFSELRTLILMQASGVALMTMASLVVNNRVGGRLAGIGDSLLSNPNDLAMNIAINWPLCLAFFLSSKSGLKKALWGIALLGIAYAVMVTYSRSGFLALLLGAVVSLWEFGIRGRRFYMVAVALLCAMTFVVVSPQNYSKRLATLVGIRQKGDKDRGSAEARENLLLESLKVTAMHPLFGVGPGNFASYTQTWRVTHNTYTEFSSECGIPALIMFIILLGMAFRNVNRVRKSKVFDRNSEIRLFSSALFASLCAYILGAFFSSSAYQLFSYYMVTYTVLLYQITHKDAQGNAPAVRTPTEAYVPALGN